MKNWKRVKNNVSPNWPANWKSKEITVEKRDSRTENYGWQNMNSWRSGFPRIDEERFKGLGLIL